MPSKMEQAKLDALSDEALVKAILSGRSKAQFNLLVARYQQRVFDLVVSILGVRFASDAQDVTQDVFVVLYKQLDRFRHESKFSTWLYRVVFNHTIDYRRRHKHYHLLKEEQTWDLTTADARTEPDAQLKKTEEQKQVLACLERLPESQRICLYLQYWLGYSINDIAQLLVTQDNTVKSHIFRAKKQLTKMLEEAGYDR